MLISDKPHQNIVGYILLQRFLTMLYQFQLCKASVLITDKPHQNIVGHILLQRFLMMLY